MSVRSHSVRATVVIASIATVAALSGATAAQAATTPNATTNTAKAAAGWLARQFVGGNHLTTSYADTTYDDYGGTADAVLSLSAAKVAKSTITAATTWLAKNVDAYADISNTDGYGPYDGSVAKLALVAEVTGQTPTSFGGYNLLKQLKDDECPASSSTCTPGAAANIYSSVSESLAILVQARAGGSYAPSADAVGYLLSLQCPNGGFTDGTTACTDNTDASVDETAYAAMALEALGSQQAALTKTLDWLTSTRSAKGYWVVQGGPDVDSTGLAAAALEAAGRTVTSSRTWLRSQQVTTGPTLGSGASRGALKYQGKFNSVSSVKATSDGLIGLVPHAGFATLTSAGASSTVPVLALTRPRPAKATVKRGGKQKITATGFAAGEKVRFALHSGAVGTAKANAQGTVTLRFTVPRRTKAVSHVVRLAGLTSGLHVTSRSFRVTA